MGAQLEPPLLYPLMTLERNEEMVEMTEKINNASQLRTRLITLSRDGKAWAYFVWPFSRDVTFKQFASPCRVPDGWRNKMFSTDHRIAYKGKLVEFTPASIIREQNRGITND